MKVHQRVKKKKKVKTGDRSVVPCIFSVGRDKMS